MARLKKISLCASLRAGDLSQARGMLRLAADEGADLAVLPEAFACLHRKNPFSAPEPLDGLVASTLAREARRLGIWIAAGHILCHEGRIRNSVLLFDRKGRLAALYHKMFPTIMELELGVVPGAGPFVVETEFGRVGFAICYDLNFAELRLAYRDLAPSLILFCSMFRGGLQAEWWAYETRSWLATAIGDPRSVLVNPVGRTIASTDVYSRVTTATANLDFQVVHLDYSNRNLDAVRRKLGGGASFEWAEPEGVFLLTSTGRRSAREIVRAAGWENAEAYFRRARKARETVLAGGPIPRGPSPW